MKTQNYSIITVLTLGLAFIPMARGADGAKPATTVSMSQLKSDLTSVQQHIATTMVSLERVKASGDNEAALAKATSEFTKNFRDLESQVEVVRKQAVTLKALANEHFAAWQKELGGIQNADIREKASSRFSEAKEQFEKIVVTADEAKKEAVPFIAELKDIVTYLDIDSSTKAAKSLSGTIWKAGNKARSVSGSISDVNEQIERTIKMMPKT